LNLGPVLLNAYQLVLGSASAVEKEGLREGRFPTIAKLKAQSSKLKATRKKEERCERQDAPAPVLN